jgi:hypothetical protein
MRENIFRWIGAGRLLLVSPRGPAWACRQAAGRGPSSRPAAASGSSRSAAASGSIAPTGTRPKKQLLRLSQQASSTRPRWLYIVRVTKLKSIV